MNILFLGGAKRVSMCRHFKGCDPDVRVFSYELSRNEAISCEATVVEGLRWSNPMIFEHLHRTAKEHQIEMLVPFVDGAVEVAARYHQLHPEVFVPVGDPEMAATMFDKVKAADTFQSNGFTIPATNPPHGPYIAKPRRGSASKGIVVADDKSSLPANREDYLIQQYIPRREEYTVDCYISVNSGEPLCISPRRRLEVSGGEVVSTITVDDKEIIITSQTILTTLGLRGAVTLQFIRDLDSGRLLLMEINPRLGGGCVCTICAGGNIPAMMLNDASEKPQQRVCATSGVLVKRYFNETVFYPE